MLPSDAVHPIEGKGAIHLLVETSKRSHREDEEIRRLEKFSAEITPRLFANGRFRRALDALLKRQEHIFNSADSTKRNPFGEAMRRLQKKGLPPVLPPEIFTLWKKQMSGWIPTLTALAVVKKTLPQHRERYTFIVAGRTWKSVKEFADRIRRMADKIDELNDSKFFSYLLQITEGTSEFTSLAYDLRNYAGFVEAASGQLRKLRKRQAGRPSRIYSPQVVNLSNWVQLLAGYYCDREVAELLNAADLVLNLDDASSGLRFDTQTLLDLRSRHKRNRRQT